MTYLKRLWGRIRDTDWKDLFKRARRTFLQAAIPIFTASFATNISKAQLWALVLSAIAAGISAVTNLFAAGPGTSGPVVPGEVPPLLA